MNPWELDWSASGEELGAAPWERDWGQSIPKAEPEAELNNTFQAFLDSSPIDPTLSSGDIPSFESAPQPDAEPRPEPTLWDKTREYINPYNTSMSEEIAGTVRQATGDLNIPRQAGELLAGGVIGTMNAPRNIATTVDALQPSARDKYTDMPTLSQILSENLPHAAPRADSGWEQAGSELANVGIGMVGGGALASRMAQNAGRVGRGAATLLGAELGAATTLHEDTKPLAVGENSSMQLTQGFSGGDKENKREQTLRNKANLAAEGVAVGAAAAPVIRLLSLGGSLANDAVFKPLLRLWSQSSKEKLVADPLIDIVRSSRPDLADKPERETVKWISDTLEKNSKASIGGRVIERDTISALEIGLDPRKDATLLEALRSYRSGMVGKNTPQLKAAMNAPVREMQDTISRTTEQLGGEDAISAAGRNIQRAGQEEVGAQRALVEEAEARLAGQEQTVDDLLRTDPALGGDQARIMGDEVDLGLVADVNARRGAIKDSLVDQVEEVRGTFRSLLDEADDSLIVNNAKELDNYLTTLGKDEDMPREILELMAEADGSWKEIYTKVRPAINKWAQANQDKPLMIDRLREFTRIADEGIPEGTPAQAAVDYYRNIYAPTLRDGPMAKIEDLYVETLNRGRQDADKAPRTPEGGAFRPYDFREGMENIVSESRLKNIEKSAQIVDILKDRGELDRLTDYIVADIVSNIAEGSVSATTRVGELASSTTIDQMVKAIQPYSAVLKEASPEQFNRLNSFVNTLKKSKGNIEETRRLIEGQEELLKHIQEDVYGRRLKGFFDAQGVPLGNHYEVFNRMFSNTQSGDQIRGLVDMAVNSGDPIVEEGIKAAYLKSLGARLQTASGDMSKSQWQKIRDDLHPIMDYGDTVFQKSPQVMEDIRALIEESGRIMDSKPSSLLETFKDSVTTEAKGAVGMVITHIFGVLSRIGARARAGSSAYISNLKPDQEMARIRDTLLANAEEFSEVLRRYPSKDDKISKEMRQYINRTIARTFLIDSSEIESAEALSEAEGRGKKRSVEKQTEKALEKDK